MTTTESELERIFCPFKWLDMQRLTEISNDVDLMAYEIFEIIDQHREDNGYIAFDLIDPI